MKYIATLFLVLMTLAFVVCGFLLWRCRKETHDYSRTIQAIFSWASAFIFHDKTISWASRSKPSRPLQAVQQRRSV